MVVMLTKFDQERSAKSDVTQELHGVSSKSRKYKISKVRALANRQKHRQKNALRISSV